jgi:hypothetical protein
MAKRTALKTTIFIQESDGRSGGGVTGYNTVIIPGD